MSTDQIHTRRPRQTSVVAGLAMLAALSLAAPLFAEAPTKTANDLLQESGDLIEKGDLEGAYKLLILAWKLEKNHDTASQLGITELTTQKWRDAAEHFEFADRNFPTDGDARREPWRETLTWLLGQAKEKVGTARIRLTASDGRSLDKAEVLVGSTVVGNWPLEAREIYVDPGQRTFIARLPGCTDATWKADVKANTAFEVPLKLTCQPAAPPKPKPKPKK